VYYREPLATQVEDPGFLRGDAVSSAFPQGKKNAKSNAIFGFHLWPIPET